ncbi:hypothetical protein BZL29_7896 [Mycobacterium kansasii]|uniref:Uncharacterized protein n=1 Tax=Mycobacterium kansasii TaxID=1768 RepID=A0A1V3WEA5_MYCKA|nr:hypothetical protein BZL29_7896 [Mycobacterium kansasii]
MGIPARTGGTGGALAGENPRRGSTAVTSSPGPGRMNGV